MLHPTVGKSTNVKSLERELAERTEAQAAIARAATGLPRGTAPGAETALLDSKKNGAGRDNGGPANQGVLCEQTLQGLRELSSDMGGTFFAQLLKTFEQDAMEHLVNLRSAVAACETVRVRQEAHALKGSSLTIGARGMADLCKQLENLGSAQRLEDAPQELARLESEFARVQQQLEQESLIL